MEVVLTRFPHLGENILQKLNSKSLIECRKVNRTFKNFMKVEKSSYLHVIQWYTNCSESLMRKIVDKSGSAIIIVSILREIFGDFKRGTKQNSEYLQYEMNTPLHLAANRGQLAAYQLIMENIDNKNPAHCISPEMQVLNKEKEESFLGFGSNISTPLHLAAKNGHLSVCKLIVENVSDKNPTSQATQQWINQWTPFHLAAHNGHFSVCELLIDNISEKNPGDHTGWTPLHSAAQNGHFGVVKLIMSNISARQVCNAIDKYGNTPLKLATQYHYNKIRRAIQKYIFDAEAKKNNYLKDIHFQKDVEIHETLQYDVESQSWIHEVKDYSRGDEEGDKDKEDKDLQKEANEDLEQGNRKTQKSKEASSNKMPFEGDSSASIPAKICRY